MFLSVIPSYIVYRIIDTTTTSFFLPNGHVPFSLLTFSRQKENESNDGILS